MSSTHKAAIVTGAGSGIGRAVALALMKDGYDTALAGRRKDALEKTAELGKATNSRSIVVPTDVGNPAADGHRISFQARKRAAVFAKRRAPLISRRPDLTKPRIACSIEVRGRNGRSASRSIRSIFSISKSH